MNVNQFLNALLSIATISATIFSGFPPVYAQDTPETPVETKDVSNSDECYAYATQKGYDVDVEHVNGVTYCYFYLRD